MMNIYYKDIMSEDDFEIINDDTVIDINTSIIKIQSDINIKNVQIDDEIITNNPFQNCITIFKVKTSKRDKIDMKIALIGENGKELIRKKCINISDKSRDYNRNELEVVKKLGGIALENLNSGLNNDDSDYYENILNNLNINLEDIEDIYNTLKIVLKLVKSIGDTPKVELIESETLNDSNEVKKITSQSARYFIMHPEHWYKEGDTNPKPIKLLTESFSEDKDIYENRLIKFILYKCKKTCRKILFSLETQESTIKASVIKNEAIIDISEFEDVFIEESKNIISLKKNQLRVTKESINKFKSIIKEIDILLRSFKDITLNKKLKIKITQKILYDKRYYRVFNLYKNKISKLDFSSEEVVESNYSVIYSYMLIAAESICKTLRCLGFYKIDVNRDIIDIELFKTYDEIKFTGYHYGNEEDFKFTLELNSLHGKSSENIILKLMHGENIEEIVFNINFSCGHKIKDLNDIDIMYERFESHKRVVVLNTISLDNLNFEDSHIKGKAIFKLDSLGNNFINKKDYLKYGAYKQGMISFTPNDLSSVYDKFIKLFRLEFIKIGFYKHCISCGGGEYLNISEELIQCSICGNKIAINKCRYCEETLIKFLTKSDIENFNYKDNKEDIIEYHNNYQIKSVNLGSCYEKYYSNSGGFCSSCGKCQKSDDNCIRCKIINLEEKYEYNR